jgi:hypothetical protein
MAGTGKYYAALDGLQPLSAEPLSAERLRANAWVAWP